MAKTVNFGVIYGMSAHGLAARLEHSREEAAKFIDAYFARYPKVLEYQDEAAGGMPPTRLRQHHPGPTARDHAASGPIRPTSSATSPSARRSTWRFRAPPPT